MFRRIAIAFVAVSTLALSPTWAGRPDKDWKDWFGHVGLGWSLVESDASDILDDDMYFNGGAVYWPTTWKFGIDLDLAYSSYDVSSSAIDAINDALEDDGQERSITNGDSNTWSVTVNGIWSPGESRIYLTGGVGAYYVDTQINTTGLIYYPPVCDPYWYWCYPGGIGTGSIPVTSESTTEFGWNAGVGVNFEVGTSGSQLYVEAKYHGIELDRGTLAYIPILIGYRW